MELTKRTAKRRSFLLAVNFAAVEPIRPLTLIDQVSCVIARKSMVTRLIGVRTHKDIIVLWRF
jgi:hypothetical protein